MPIGFRTGHLPSSDKTLAQELEPALDMVMLDHDVRLELQEKALLSGLHTEKRVPTHFIADKAPEPKILLT